ncbi:hypothetical protein BEWA_008110 [Theileria equi strain WA]|uniref:PH domain-containing protein n=1 Tax=Theileria equi strain WA TaxID=1537102 RepID=L0B2G5_THEEQ|nr:hypothetical protein BEWA_008110 [Theileria equi strain WA]AFZ81401.1 hypothetical protein BEWA_008110 [Theileria equi strain WA]|eukprot:XP_004831067.1 hypothetical protein BEWA_008110 [Theileria equi strain WA]
MKIFDHTFLFYVVLYCLPNFICYTHCLNTIQNTNKLDHTLAIIKDKDPLEEAEISEAYNIHSFEDEIKNKELLDTGSKNDIVFSHKLSGCDTLRDDIIEVAVDPIDILKTQEFICGVTPNELRLYFKDRNNKSSNTLKKGKLFSRFSLNAIVTPLETIKSSRECFRLFYKSEPLVFCGKDAKARDLWMTSILKAKFCHYAHTNLNPAHKPETGTLPQSLPKFSTKAERLKSRLLDKINDDVELPLHDNKITNVDIKNILTGEPQIFLNGDEVIQNDTKTKTGQTS